MASPLVSLTCAFGTLGSKFTTKELNYHFCRMFEYMQPLIVDRWPLVVILLLLCSSLSFGQDSAATKLDSIAPVLPQKSISVDGSHRTSIDDQPSTKKKRIRLLAAGNLVAYTGSMTALYQIWYKDYPQTHFHFFNDNKEWLQVDKAGHAYSAYVASRASMEMWRWAGLKRNQRIWIGGMSGAFYQTVIETLDGFSAEWGWSWGDFAANMFGSGLLVSQELAWDEQRISFKFSTHHKSYPDGELGIRANQLFGKSFGERVFKDYNANTLWLSANLKSFFGKSHLPGWLNIAVGYGAEGMYGGEANIWVDKQGIGHNRTDIPRYRQFYISPDIDLTRIKTRSKPLKIALFVLNSFKFPAPALEWSQGKLKGNWIQF
jgi:uncharacterized protein YfiM (DUF2279 family)